MTSARSRLARVVLVILLGLFGALMGSGIASAHAALTGSDPEDGATIIEAPASITLSFNESPSDFEATVVITAPDGTTITGTDVTVDGNDLIAQVRPITAAGRYAIAYRVVSSDGHPVSGQLHFSFVPPRASSSAPAPTSPTPTTSWPSPASSTSSSSSSSQQSSVASPTISSSIPSSSATPSAGPSTSTAGAMQSTSSMSASVSSAPSSQTSSVPTGSAPTDGDAGMPGWIWILIGVAGVLALVGLVVYVIRTRRS